MENNWLFTIKELENSPSVKDTMLLINELKQIKDIWAKLSNIVRELDLYLKI